jgi:hypothetical protein
MLHHERRLKGACFDLVLANLKHTLHRIRQQETILQLTNNKMACLLSSN